MGCRILYDRNSGRAALYCSTTEFAFGPVFVDGGRDQGDRDGAERAEAFLRWLQTYDAPPKDLNVVGTARWARSHDPRDLTDAGLEAAFSLWQMEELSQYEKEGR